MVKYQGNKSKYAGKICNIIRQTCGHDIQLADLCCGSGEITFYWGRPTLMVDLGPWGTFWRFMQLYKYKPRDGDIFLDEASYEHYCWKVCQKPVPQDPYEFCMAFLALQREAFQGKPVNVVGGSWGFPGFDGNFSKSAFVKAWTNACKMPIKTAVVADLNKFIVPREYVLYVDPDYAGTTGYGNRTLNVEKFARNHPDHHIFVSHHTPLSGQWDNIHDVTISDSGREERRSSKVDTELLHYRRPLGTSNL